MQLIIRVVTSGYTFVLKLGHIKKGW